MMPFILIILLFILAISFGVSLVIRYKNKTLPKLYDQRSLMSVFTGPSKGHEYLFLIVGLVWVVVWSAALIAFVYKNIGYFI